MRKKKFKKLELRKVQVAKIKNLQSIYGGIDPNDCERKGTKLTNETKQTDTCQ